MNNVEGILVFGILVIIHQEPVVMLRGHMRFVSIMSEKFFVSGSQQWAENSVRLWWTWLCLLMKITGAFCSLNVLPCESPRNTRKVMNFPRHKFNGNWLEWFPYLVSFVPDLNHSYVGAGRPSALHFRVTATPSNSVTSLSCSFHDGGSKIKHKKFWHNVSTWIGESEVWRSYVAVSNFTKVLSF